MSELYDQVQNIDDRTATLENVASVFPLDQSAIDDLWTGLKGNKFQYGQVGMLLGIANVIDNNANDGSLVFITSTTSAFAYFVTITSTGFNGFTVTSSGGVGDSSILNYLIIYN